MRLRRGIAAALLDRPRLDAEELAHAPTATVSERVRDMSEAEIRSALRHDPWVLNYVLSVWERDRHRAVVTTRPWHQAYVVTEHCNARCAFCTYWLNRESVIDRAFFEHLRPVLGFARSLVLTGGEPTLHPDFAGMLADFARWTDPRCFRTIITNGLKLDEVADDLIAFGYHASISLNAGVPELHHKIMRLGPDALPRIADSIRRLKAAGRYVSVSYVVTVQSLHGVPDYLALCDELGVDLAYLRTPTPIDEGYVHWEGYGAQAPVEHPDFEELRADAVGAIAAARTPVDAYPEQWGIPTPAATGSEAPARDLRDAVRSPARRPELRRGGRLPGGDPFADGMGADPYGREAPLGCDHVYFSLESMTREHRLEPCCFMPQVQGFEPIGLLGSDDFDELWNAPAMVHLRERLAAGPLLPICKVCTYHRLGY